MLWKLKYFCLIESQVFVASNHKYLFHQSDFIFSDCGDRTESFLNVGHSNQLGQKSFKLTKTQIFLKCVWIGSDWKCWSIKRSHIQKMLVFPRDSRKERCIMELREHTLAATEWYSWPVGEQTGRKKEQGIFYSYRAVICLLRLVCLLVPLLSYQLNFESQR